MTTNTDLLGWLDGPGHLLGELDDLVRGDDGWVWVLDPEQTPDVWLRWVGQLAGVRVPADIPAGQQRRRVLETAGQRRGTPAAIRGAAAELLDGSRLVRLEERTDGDGEPDPYHLRVTTFATETDDPDAVERVLRLQKPAGLILHYRVLEGQTWRDVLDTHDTWEDVLDTHDTWEDLLTTVPEDT